VCDDETFCTSCMTDFTPTAGVCGATPPVIVCPAEATNCVKCDEGGACLECLPGTT
jgi:hypothetical protein